jgi:glutathione S-transferase
LSAPAVRIYGVPVSTWTRTVRMVCIEKGIAHELVPVARASPEHRSLHPFARYPVVEIGGTVLFESLAIVSHLDEVFPEPRLQPEGIAARTRMCTWMSVCGDYVFRDVVLAIPRQRVPSEAELATARDVLERAEALMTGDAFLAGDALSLADLYLAPQLANCAEKAPQLLEDLPALAAWSARMGERESFVRTARAPA